MRQGFNALRVGGVEALLPFFTTDVVMHPFPEWPDDPVYRGYDGARKLIAAWTDNFEDWGIDVRELRAAGLSVVALTEMTGEIKGSRVPIRQPMGVVFSNIHENTAGEVHFFLTWLEALKAAGLKDGGMPEKVLGAAIEQLRIRRPAARSSDSRPANRSSTVLRYEHAGHRLGSRR